MPLVRYEIRSEYELANRELYRSAPKNDPEAILEGVAMVSLVGIVRQLGDLAEFAADIFHDLHEAVMATASRSHDLSARVTQLEAELPALEKMVFSKKANPLQYAYAPGVDWHASIRNDQNHCTQGDLPRFIRSSYEECRGPPRLFLLDKFDIGGVGACLKRYTDPSFFKMEWASSELMKAEKAQQDKKARKGKKTRRRKDGEVKESRPAVQIQPRVRYSSISMSSLDGLSESTTPLTAMAVDNELGNKSFPFVTFLGGSQHSSSKESAPNKLDLPKVVKPVRTSFKGTDENVQPEETKESITGGKESVARDDADDAASEPENYMDAMTTMESETDSEPRDRRRLSNFKMSVEQPELDTDSKTNDNDAYFEDARNSTMDSETEVDSKYSLDLTPMPVDPLSAQELPTSTTREVHDEDMLSLAKETWVEEAVGSREHESVGSEEPEPSLEPLLEPAHENAMDDAVSEHERRDDQVLSEKEDVQEGARESQSIPEDDDDEVEEDLIPESVASSEAKDHIQELSGTRTGSDDEPFDVEVIQVIGDDRNQKVDLEPLSVSDDDSTAQADVRHPMEREIVEDYLLKSEESTAREDIVEVADEPSTGFSHADMPSEQEEVHEKNVDSLALETVTQSPVHENEYALIEEVRDSDAAEGGYLETKMPGDFDHLEMKVAEDTDHLERKVAENGDHLEIVGERLEMKVEEDNVHPAEDNDDLEMKVAEDNGHLEMVAEDNDHLEMKVAEATDHLGMKVAEELERSPLVKTIHVDEVEEETVPPMVIATDQEGNENVTEEPDDATSSTPVALAKESHELDRSIPLGTLVDEPDEKTNTPPVSPVLLAKDIEQHVEPDENVQPSSPVDDYESASSHEDFFLAQDHDRSSSRFSDFSDDLSWHNEGMEVDEHKEASDGYSGYEDFTGNERSVNEVRTDETFGVLSKETPEVFSQPDRDLGEFDQQPANFAHVEDDNQLQNRSFEENQLQPEFTERVEDGLHTSEQSPRSQLLAHVQEVDAEKQLSFEKRVDVEDFALPETVPKSDQRQVVDVEDSVPKSDQRELVDFKDSTPPEMSPKSDQLQLVDFEDSSLPEMVPKSDQPQLVDFEDSTLPEMVPKSDQPQLVNFEDSTLPEMVPKSEQPQLVEFKDSTVPEMFFKSDQRQLVDFDDSTLPEMVIKSDQRQLVDVEDSTLPEMVTKSDQRQLVDVEDSAPLSVLTVVVPETQDNEATFLSGSADELMDKSPVSGKETSPEVSVSSSPRSPIFSALHAPMSPARSFESLSNGLTGFTSLPAPSSPTSSSTVMEEMPPLPPLPPLRWRTVMSPRPQEILPRLETLQQELFRQTEVPKKQDAVEQPTEAIKPSESSQGIVEDQPKVPSAAEAPAQSQMLEREVDLLDVSGSHTQDVPKHEPELMQTEVPELVDSRLEVPECHPEHAELRSDVLEPVPPKVHRTALEHQPEAVEPSQVMEDHMLEQPVQPRSEQPEVKEPCSEAHAGELEDEKPKLEPKAEPVLEQSPGVKAVDSQRPEPGTPPRAPFPNLEDDSRVLPVSTMPSSRKHPSDDALVQAISGHDRSKLRRVPSDTRSKAPDEREFLLEQIRSQSFNLRHTVVERKETKEAPPRLVTNINVAAILEKANAIRQAFAGSDDDDEEDDWSE